MFSSCHRYAPIGRVRSFAGVFRWNWHGWATPRPSGVVNPQWEPAHCPQAWPLPARSVHEAVFMQRLILDQKYVQYEVKSGEVETRTIEISSPSCGIHRGRLNNAMKDHIAKLLPQKSSKNFHNFWNFSGNVFIFRISKKWKLSENVKNRKSEKFQIFEIWKMKLFSEKNQKILKIFLDIFFGKRFEILSFITLSNLPRWIPHYGDDISIVRISTSTDLNSYWTWDRSKISFCTVPPPPQCMTVKTLLTVDFTY